MKNFISSIYIRTNSLSDEKICVGLFIGGGEESFFAWSDHKLKFTTKLFSEDVYSSLNRTFVNLKKDICGKTEKKLQSEMFSTHNPYTIEYLEYLNNYDNGVIEFNRPKTIPNSVSDKEFAKLFELYVGESLPKEPSPKKETFYKRIKSYLDKPVFNERANTFYKVPNELIDTIYRSQSVDFISCNGNIFAGHSIDFNAGADTVESKLYEFRALVEGLSLFAKKRNLKGKGKYFVYHNDPAEKEQKKILRSVLKDSTKLFELAPVEEIEKAASILESSDKYRKFSEVIPD